MSIGNNQSNTKVSRPGTTLVRNGRNLVLFLIVLLFHDQIAFAKASDSTREMHVRNGIWYAPVGRPTTINGLTLSGYPTTLKKKDSLIINGILIDANPITVFITPFLFIRLLGAAFYGDSAENSIPYPDLETPLRKNIIVRGVSISTGLMPEGEIEGLAINGFYSSVHRMKGVEITGVANLHYSFKGLMASIFWNQSTIGKGVQIGLINRCKDGRVFQLGLINRIGKRTLPIINFSFKRKH